MRTAVVTVDSNPEGIPDVSRRPGERGQGMVEYAFILLLVAIVVLISVALLGHTTGNLYSNVSRGLGP